LVCDGFSLAPVNDAPGNAQIDRWMPVGITGDALKAIRAIDVADP
jgi:hypothetical protein